MFSIIYEDLMDFLRKLLKVIVLMRINYRYWELPWERKQIFCECSDRDILGNVLFLIPVLG